jgi:hypothetical protein
MERCTSSLLPTKHTWPEWIKAQLSRNPGSDTSLSRSTSSNTMEALLPPHSSCTFFKLLAALRMTAWPLLVDPVNATIPRRGELARRLPTDSPGPFNQAADVMMLCSVHYCFSSSTCYDIQAAFWQSSLKHQSCKLVGATCRVFGGLCHNRISCRQRWRNLLY